MAFTVGADYFLVLHDIHITGVSVFWFAHIFYAARAVNSGITSYTGRASFRQGFCYVVIICALGARFVTGLGNVLIPVVVYACLFGASIFLNFYYRRTLHNAPLVLAGLVLFVLCDICVMLFNIPRYFDVLENFMRLLPLIWVFYLPAQALLAVSAIDFKRGFLHDRRI
ncbi:MAG: lysoplasmalogenase family protein [Defluviitaleaceae bacterium]|nr:lysoplasmalogenase family protein [Defluviitaleaceae bacterium]MCL2275351.1 lysoplasmalogenase family protein [Defluviitaleaceae bacterium]